MVPTRDVTANCAYAQFFLEHLVGRRRKSLKLKDPKKFGWNPKDTLAQIAGIYVHLSRADASGRFAAEVATSLDADLLHEAAQVRQKLDARHTCMAGLMPVFSIAV